MTENPRAKAARLAAEAYDLLEKSMLIRADDARDDAFQRTYRNAAAEYRQMALDSRRERMEALNGQD